MSGASSAAFNGKYEVSTLAASGAPEKDVYRIHGGNKVIFWKNAIGWALGSTSSLTPGQYNYNGKFWNDKPSSYV